MLNALDTSLANTCSAQAPPKKKLKTAPVTEKAPQKNGAVANGDEEYEEAEGEEDEEFDEEDEEGDEEEDEDGEEEEAPAKGVGKVAAATGDGKAESKAVAAGGDEED